jgi:hypothetical protein
VTLSRGQKISACNCSQLGAIRVEYCQLVCFPDSLSQCRFRNEAQNSVEEVEFCKVLLFINCARHKNCQVRCARYVVEYCCAFLGHVDMGHIRPCRSVIKNRNRPLTVIMTVLRRDSYSWFLTQSRSYNSQKFEKKSSTKHYKICSFPVLSWNWLVFHNLD